MSQPIIQGTSPYTLLITVETINFRGNKAPKAENEQMSALPMKTPETRVDFEKQQRQQRARIILDHYELLIQYAIENDKVGFWNTLPFGD